MNPLCYDNMRLGICMMNGKMYWMVKNMKFDSQFLMNRDPIMLDLAPENDNRVCLQYDRVVCFAKNKNNENPEGRMKEITQELKRRESELRRQRIEQERLKTLDE